MKNICPGPFRGRIALPLPLDCDAIHFLFGILTGSFLMLDAGDNVTTTLLLCFVLYQALEELPDNDWPSFVKDCLIFLAGVCFMWGIRNVMIGQRRPLTQCPAI